LRSRLVQSERLGRKRLPRQPHQSRESRWEKNAPFPPSPAAFLRQLARANRFLDHVFMNLYAGPSLSILLAFSQISRGSARDGRAGSVVISPINSFMSDEAQGPRRVELAGGRFHGCCAITEVDSPMVGNVVGVVVRRSMDDEELPNILRCSRGSRRLRTIRSTPGAHYKTADHKAEGEDRIPRTSRSSHRR